MISGHLKRMISGHITHLRSLLSFIFFSATVYEEHSYIHARSFIAPSAVSTVNVYCI